MKTSKFRNRSKKSRNRTRNRSRNRNRNRNKTRNYKKGIKRRGGMFQPTESHAQSNELSAQETESQSQSIESQSQSNELSAQASETRPKTITLYTDRTINVTFVSDNDLIPINCLLEPCIIAHNNNINEKRKERGAKLNPIRSVSISPRVKYNIANIVSLSNDYYKKHNEYQIYLKYLIDNGLLRPNETLDVYKNDGTINIDLHTLINCVNEFKVKNPQLKRTISYLESLFFYIYRMSIIMTKIDVYHSRYYDLHCISKSKSGIVDLGIINSNAEYKPGMFSIGSWYCSVKDKSKSIDVRDKYIKIDDSKLCVFKELKDSDFEITDPEFLKFIEGSEFKNMLLIGSDVFLDSKITQCMCIGELNYANNYIFLKITEKPKPINIATSDCSLTNPIVISETLYYGSQNPDH
jgi:hypothetical protein